MKNMTPKAYPGMLRLIFAILAFIIIGLTFHIMSKLTAPSVFVNAIKIVKTGAQTADNIKNLSFLNFKNYLYLNGSIVSATSEMEDGVLFIPDSEPSLLPSTFVDNTGAVEVMAPKEPLTAENPDTYYYKQPYHLLGWRSGTSGFTLFAIAHSQKSLLATLEKNAAGWKTSFFIYGLILAILVFVTFWLLNMSLLSTPYLEIVQLLIVNVVFLVLFYSVLFLSGYPLLATVFQTLEILVIANIIFIPVSLLIRKKRTA